MGGERVNIDELDRLAKAATPGPWHVEKETLVCYTHAAGIIPLSLSVAIPCAHPLPANAAYIAAANPAAVLELVAELRRLRAESSAAAERELHRWPGT